jgi:hypothetical protein
MSALGVPLPSAYGFGYRTAPVQPKLHEVGVKAKPGTGVPCGEALGVPALLLAAASVAVCCTDAWRLEVPSNHPHGEVAQGATTATAVGAAGQNADKVRIL